MPDDKAYTLDFTDSAKEDLRRVDKKNAERIVKKMRWVAENTLSLQHDALTGQWSGYYRWRIGDYRAIYELDHNGRLVIVAVVGHRREVYDE